MATTEAKIADQMVEELDDSRIREIATEAARRGYLAGLEKAARFVSNEWPQGQYDRFNEHSLSKNLQATIKRVKARKAE